MCKWVTCLLAILIASLTAPVAFGQIVYLPVQHEYGIDHRFYYGGNDLRVLERAQRDTCAIQRSESVRPTPPMVRVYDDCIPTWNAAIFGVTPSDARNAANAGVPRYWTKRDALQNAIAQPDGSIIVPARPWVEASTSAGYSLVRTAPATGPAAEPSTAPRPLLIIPKDMLIKPAPPDGRLASAR